jgi:hypothetical protein
MLFRQGIHSGIRRVREDHTSFGTDLRYRVSVGEYAKSESTIVEYPFENRDLGPDVGTDTALANMPSIEQQINRRAVAARPTGTGIIHKCIVAGSSIRWRQFLVQQDADL